MLKIPARLLANRQSSYVELIFDTPIETFWDDATKAFRNAAKDNPLYHTKIDNGGVRGKTGEGYPLVINSLGKWLFGTRGYKGHVLFMPLSSNSFIIYYPTHAPDIVCELLSSITCDVVMRKSIYWGDTDYEPYWMSNTLV